MGGDTQSSCRVAHRPRDVIIKRHIGAVSGGSLSGGVAMWNVTGDGVGPAAVTARLARPLPHLPGSQRRRAPCASLVIAILGSCREICSWRIPPAHPSTCDDRIMPAGAVLRKVQKNEVLEILRNAGLDPSQFSWEQRYYSSGKYQGPAELLVHGSSGFFFEFSLRDGSRHFARMSPGPEASQDSAYPGSWELQRGYVERWAADVRAELEAPDLWDSLPSWHSLTELPPIFEENSRFTQAELIEINERLDAIGAQLTSLAESNDLRTLAHGLIEHLRGEAPRQGRRDWVFLALGALLSFMVNAAFDPSRVREMIDLLVHGVRSLGAG
jgi:hypothetical protein